MMCQCSVADPLEHEVDCPLHGSAIIARSATARLTKIEGGVFHVSTPTGDDERMRRRFTAGTEARSRMSPTLWAAVDDEESFIRRALGQWVSGLEPVLIRRAGDGRLMGLGVEGSGEPVIPR